MIDMLNGCNSSVSLPDELNLNFFNDDNNIFNECFIVK